MSDLARGAERSKQLSKLAQELEPFLVQRLARISTNSATVTGSLTAHSLSGPYHTGSLAESQAPWAVTESEFSDHTTNPNAHHSRLHDMLSTSDHFYIGGAALDLFGLSAANTLALLTPSANPGAASAILKSDSSGFLTLPQLTATTKIVTPLIDATGDLTLSPDGLDVILDTSVNLSSTNFVSGTAGWKLPATGAADILSISTNELTSRQSLYGANTAFRVLHHTHDYDHAHVVVNPGVSWNLDEQFGVDIDDNLLVRGYIVGKHAIQLPGAMMICHYDGAEPYETNFTGNPMGHMGQVGEETGGVIYREGKFGKAVQIAETTTNLVINPSFENDITGWGIHTTGTGGGSAGRSADYSLYGTYSCKVVKNAGANGDDYGIFTTCAVTSGQPYTMSAWVHVTAISGTTPSFTLLLDDGTNSDSDSVSAVTTEWVRLSATISSAAASPVTCFLYFDLGQGTAYVDAVQVEEKTAETPYCDGSLGTDHGWTGTDHASTSRREHATLTYNTGQVISPYAITTGAWVKWGGNYSGFIVAHPSIHIEFL